MEVKKRVLVVDDEYDLCCLVRDNLERTGRYEVVFTTDESQVEDLCLAKRPDIVILDVVMPKRRGSEIAYSLKNDQSTKHIPIIIMSGLGEMVYFRRANQWRWVPGVRRGIERSLEGLSPAEIIKVFGVEDYVAKPFSSDTLIEAIEAVLQRISTSA